MAQWHCYFVKRQGKMKMKKIPAKIVAKLLQNAADKPGVQSALYYSRWRIRRRNIKGMLSYCVEPNSAPFVRYSDRFAKFYDE